MWGVIGRPSEFFLVRAQAGLWRRAPAVDRNPAVAVKLPRIGLDTAPVLPAGFTARFAAHTFDHKARVVFSAVPRDKAAMMAQLDELMHAGANL